MSTISKTIQIDEDSAGIITGLLSHFSKGQRVLVALSDEPETTVGSKADLVDWLLACPEKDWFTSAEVGETTDDLKPLSFRVYGGHQRHDDCGDRKVPRADSCNSKRG